MKVQHVQALSATDDLPSAVGLPDGYAIIKDGKTWTVRSEGWAPATGGGSSGGGGSPDPDPDAPPPVGVPSEAELATYASAFGTLDLQDTSWYDPDPVPITTGLQLFADPGGIPALVATEEGLLLMRRPGYYRVSLELVQGDVPTGVRGHVIVMPQNGVQTALTVDHGQHSGYDGGVTYFANPDDDPTYGNQGGLVLSSLMVELPASADLPDPPFQVRFRITPVIFTGPEVPITPLCVFSNIVVTVAGSGHIHIEVDVSGADSVRAMVTKVESGGSDTGFVGEWTPMSGSSGHYSVTLEVTPDFNLPVGDAAYISISGTNGEYTNGISYRFYDPLPT